MKVYIAGPMQGLPDFNFPAFFEAEEILVGLGWETINPARVDATEGFVPGTDHDTATVTPEAHCQYMRRDIALVLGCDGVVLLSGWETSSGANVELAVARAIGLAVFDLIDGQPVPSNEVPSLQLAHLMSARAEMRYG